MAFRYIIQPNSPDSHQADPWWFAVIVRFKSVQTFDRATITAPASDQELNVSLAEADAFPVAEREPLILTSQIVAFNVNYSKASHTCSAAFRVVPGVFSFEAQTHAGDWVLFWAFDNADDYTRVLELAVNTLRGAGGPTPNGFLDGLKFVGRLNAPKRKRGVDPTSGMPRKEYELTSVGFGEFDAKVYYNQAHQAKYAELANGFIAQVSDIAANQNSTSKVDQEIASGVPLKTGEHAQIWLQTFLGAGPGDVSKKGFDKDLVGGTAFGKEEEATGSLLQSPNDIFLVPASVGKLLGVSSTQSLRYFDLLNVFIGVQGPSGQLEATRDLAADFADVVYQGFVPFSIGEPSGSFRAQYMNFGMVTVWDLISGFSNQPLNEMFVSLRVGANGKVKPSFILRQNPMSSVRAATNMSDRGWAMTAFVDLPRWVIDDQLVIDESVGPSDSLHYNYVHVQGTDPIAETAVQLATINVVLSPPMADVADIKRSGLRPFVATLNSDITGQIEARGQLGRGYTQFMADILMDQHLKWSGTLVLKGIQEPIMVGDNLEHNEVIYHIETVVHSGHIDTGSGRKNFDTTLQLSNGISKASEWYADNIMPYETVDLTNDNTSFETRPDSVDKLGSLGALKTAQDEALDGLRQRQAAKQNKAALDADIKDNFQRFGDILTGLTKSGL